MPISNLEIAYYSRIKYRRFQLTDWNSISMYVAWLASSPCSSSCSRGAGRPAKSARSGAPHKERSFLHARYPVHVTLRAIAAVGNLRRRCVYQAIREATLTTARRKDFRIVQLSIQHNHIHLLVEADDKRALAAGM